MQAEKMDVDHSAPVAEPDESLYSRQIYTIGLDAMKRMAASNVLLLGLKGLGVEIAKNIILAGVKSVTLHDPEPAQIADLSSQFFLSEANVGQRRDHASLPHLAELNPYVHVSVLESKYAPETIFAGNNYQVVVCTSMPMSVMESLNEHARSHDVCFIAADTRGLAGFAFCDFGRSFTVLDATGEQPLTGMVASITHDEHGVVTCLDESRHGLEDGDYVCFSEVVGMDEINHASPLEITVLGPYTFSVGSTGHFKSGYVRGGLFKQVKMPKTISFRTLAESKTDPDTLITDFAKLDTPIQLHCAFHALSKFLGAHGRVPVPQDDEDAAKLLELAKSFATGFKDPVEIKEDFIKLFAKQAAGDLCPMTAVIGGLVAQEVLKACSCKLHPIKQYLYFDSFESLPPQGEGIACTLTKAECAPQNSRYDGQLAVFGRTMQQRFAESNLFLVGAGAIGCEMLKNWSLIGVASRGGKAIVTDMDTIEKSNLNRQFLFRNHDVGKLKAQTAAKAAQKMNTAFNIHALSQRVGEDTESVFSDAFWEPLDIVTNALDNVEARKYVDRRCVFYRKPLLESGTLGVKGSTQVVLPFVTESYSSSHDPPETSIPICTLKNFPNKIEHTIQWARDTFEGLFVEPLENAATYLKSPKAYVEKLNKSGQNVVEGLQSVKDTLVTFRPKTYDCCVTWARLKFDELFVNNVKQLLHNFPPDATINSGLPFWSGPKRAPVVCEFDDQNATHLDFIAYAAMIRAKNFGIEDTTVRPRNDENYYRGVISKIQVPKFVPLQGVKIQTNEAEAQAEKTRQEHSRPSAGGLDAQTESQVQRLEAEITPTISKINVGSLQPASFEKDDDSNHHIDLVTASSNIRAASYKIAAADRHHTKFIAGKIIPAIATTTALVTGLVCLELYKMLAPIPDEAAKAAVMKIERYRNGFLTLAGPDFAFSEPIAAPKLKYNDVTYTLWDRIEVPDMTLQELCDYFEREHELELTMMSCGVTMLYSFFMQAEKLRERRAMRISAILVSITGTPIPPHTSSLVLEVCVTTKDGADPDIPYIMVKLDRSQ